MRRGERAGRLGRLAGSLADGRVRRQGLGGMEVAGLGLLLVVVPVVFDPWGRSGLLAVKVLAASAGLALLVGGLAWARAVTVPWGWSGAAAGAALAIVAASAAVSPAWQRSLLGAPQRLGGVLMWLCLAVAFCAGLSLRRRRAEALEAAVVAMSVAAVLAVGALGLLEAAGVDWGTGSVEFEGRLRSTWGNPSVLAGFVLLLGPLCAARAVSPGRRRWAAAAALALSGVMLVGSQSRGAVLAVGAVAVVLALARSSKRQRLWIAAAVGSLAAATAVVGRWEQFGYGFRGRVAIWEVAVKAIADRPLLGAGPEMFLVEYSERVSAQAVREFGRYSTTDRAHNGILDFAVSSGIPAAVLYTAALAAVGVLAFRALSSPRPFIATLGAALLAYIVQQQLLFPHPALDAVFWLLAGVLAAEAGVGARPVRSWLGAVALAGAVLVSAANSWSLIRNDHDVEKARTAETYEAAFSHLADAADRRSFDDEPYILMGVLLKDAHDTALLARGEVRISRGEQLNPGNESVSLALAEVRLQGYRSTGDPRWADRARGGLDEVIATQPANGTAYLKRGAAWFYLGERASARADWEQAAWLLPDDETPRNNLKELGN